MLKSVRFSMSVLTLAGSMAAPVAAETLQDALAAAYASNPTLEAERTGARIADEGLAGAKAAGRVRLDVTGSAGLEWSQTNQFDGLSGGTPFGDFDLSSIGNTGTSETGALQLQATRPIYTGGRISSGIAQAAAGVDAARSSLKAARQAIALDTITAYVDVRRDLDAVRIRENNVAVLEEQTRAARDRFDVGVVTRTDVSLAEARLAGARANLAGQVAQLEGSRSTYALLVGMEPGDLVPPPPIPPLPASLEDAVAAALQNNPDLEAGRGNVRAASEAIGVAEGALRPQIDVALTGGLQRRFRDDLENESASALVRGSMPLYEAGAIRSDVRAAKLRRTQARQQVDAIERQIRAEMARAWYGYEAAQLSAEASSAQVDAAAIAYEGAKEELAVGVRTTLDVLDQEQELFDAQLALISAERDAYVAAHVLLRLTGELTPDRLGAPSDYDPTAYGERIDRKILLTDPD